MSKRGAKVKTKVFDDGRVCTGCLTRKPWKDFYKAKAKKYGYQEQCIKCHRKGLDDRPKETINANAKRYYKKNKEKILPKSKKHTSRVKRKDPLRYKASTIRGSLLRRGRDHGLDNDKTPKIDEILEWLKQQHPLKCYYTGVDLTLKTMNIDHKLPISRGGSNGFSNLCICSAGINRAKGSLSDTEFEALLLLSSTWEDGGASLLRRLKQARW